MRILLLSDTNSEHTEKWALGLAAEGIEIGLFSFNKSSYSWFENKKHITLLFEPLTKLIGNENKLSYLKHVFNLKKCIEKFNPTILHAHYATSYGFIGALSGFQPYVISAWGTDVMKFPQQNFLNKIILKYNLNKAVSICATSHTIKNYLKFVSNKSVNVIPFGVDVNLFIKKDGNSLFDKNYFVIGSIKPLEKLYNTDILISAFSLIKNKYNSLPLKLLIVGEGSQKEKLNHLAKQLNLNDDIVFTGRVPFNEIANYYNMLNVFVNISEYESFGVSVIEAMACEKPVIVTDTGGLKEIVENSNFGSLVGIRNVEETANEIEKYLLDSNLCLEIGKRARQKVIEKYNWNINILQMINIYKQLNN